MLAAVVSVAAFVEINGSQLPPEMMHPAAHLMAVATGGETILSSGFFKNPRMGLRKSTAIVHKGGPLSVVNCDLRGPTGVERLYEGDGENLV